MQAVLAAASRSPLSGSPTLPPAPTACMPRQTTSSNGSTPTWRPAAGAARWSRIAPCSFLPSWQQVRGAIWGGGTGDAAAAAALPSDAWPAHSPGCLAPVMQLQLLRSDCDPEGICWLMQQPNATGVPTGEPGVQMLRRCSGRRLPCCCCHSPHSLFIGHAAPGWAPFLHAEASIQWHRRGPSRDATVGYVRGKAQGAAAPWVQEPAGRPADPDALLQQPGVQAWPQGWEAAPPGEQLGQCITLPNSYAKGQLLQSLFNVTAAACCDACVANPACTVWGHCTLDIGWVARARAGWMACTRGRCRLQPLQNARIPPPRLVSPLSGATTGTAASPRLAAAASST